MRVSPIYVVAGVAVIAAGLYVYTKGAKNVGAQLGSAAIDLVDGAVTGAVETIGEKIGVPKTNMSGCEVAKAGGRTWDASFDCPAVDFIEYLWR